MSELQIALLAIGLIVIIAVYVFGWWQQKQYRQKFGAPFKHEHDPLYQESVHQEDFIPSQTEHTPETPIIKLDHAEATPENVIAFPEPSPIKHPEAPATNTTVSSEPVKTETQPESKPATPDLFKLIDKHSDFIIQIEPQIESSMDLLEGLWQRKFDFAKTIFIFGQAGNSKFSAWERLNHESSGTYHRFRIALQMVDRRGAIHHAELANFHDLLLGIAEKFNAKFSAPDLNQAHQFALAIDAFCASVDQLVGINLVASDERSIPARRIANVTAQFGITLEADGHFHLKDEQGHSLFTISKHDNSPFQSFHLDTDKAESLTLLLDVPRVEKPSQTFDKMVETAQALARELQLNLVDDHLVVLNNAGLTHIRREIEDIEYKMQNSIITPGSAQALRLFS